MSNPQVENGYVKIANEIIEAFAMYRLSGQERQIVDVVLRKTYGFNKKEDVISMGQFSKLTGINRPCVARLLKTLLSKKILCVTQKDNTNGNSYIFQKDFEQWKVLSKKISVIQNDNKSVIQKDNKSVINTAQKVLSKMIHTKDILTKDKEKTYKDIKTNIPFLEIIQDLNQKTGKTFRPTDATKTMIKARFSEGFTLEDFQKVHLNMSANWKNDTKMNQYLRPSTLYCASKFEGYLNIASPTPLKQESHYATGMGEKIKQLRAEADKHG